MKHYEGILISVAVAVVVVLAFDITRAHGARVFSKGKNGEDTLLFDPASAPKKS